MLSSSSTTRIVAAIGVFVWCWWPDSNGRPTDYESVALPAELHQPARAFARAAIVSPAIVRPLLHRADGDGNLALDREAADLARREAHLAEDRDRAQGRLRR